ncbi:MAG: hypothetical protein A9Z00_04085 [Thermobacillus sp. ZCTH02-B1]|uniref:DUF2487 family protein n=1 Tax=Thermobacillus sp. ZCTH02-B1 TaxID=1858795 RepID=UPI000B558262|nr:DUF2487 family protein [Thermobacillus sp. ZCTH02-B1]OUM96766.1 MAG: hypothetical protein A9Z00_04085 [Thermobacillus sp. ZCTH02-B1]
MKFSDFSSERWAEMQLYFDTAILPVTGLKGTETPDEATAALERLRDLLELVETPFRGRTVTYPALHYLTDGAEAIGRIASGLKAAGFRRVIVVALDRSLAADGGAIDLWIVPEPDGGTPDARSVSEAVQAMWRNRRDAASPAGE